MRNLQFRCAVSTGSLQNSAVDFSFPLDSLRVASCPDRAALPQNEVDTKHLFFELQISKVGKWGGLKTGGFPDLDLSFLFCPIFSFPIFPGFSRLSGDCPGIFPICPFPLSRPINSTYEARRNSPERVCDTIRTFPAKTGNPPGLEILRLTFSVSRAFPLIALIALVALFHSTRGGSPTNFLTKKCSENSPNIYLGPIVCGSDKIWQNSRLISRKISLRKARK